MPACRSALEFKMQTFCKAQILPSVWLLDWLAAPLHVNGLFAEEVEGKFMPGEWVALSWISCGFWALRRIYVYEDDIVGIIMPCHVTSESNESHDI